MQFKIKPYGNEYNFDRQSDIIELIFSVTGLRVTVITGSSKFTNVYLDIHFKNINGFRLLDEGDLIAYWESGLFNVNHHIYEILSGGWSNGESLESGMLSVSSSIGTKEWFIATTNRCLTVLSSSEPQINEFINSSISLNS